MDVKEGDKFQGKNTGKIWVVYFNSDFNCLSMHLNLDDFEWDLMIKIKEGVKR